MRKSFSLLVILVGLFLLTVIWIIWWLVPIQPQKTVSTHNDVFEIDSPDFRLLLPEGAWSDHSTPEAYAYDLADDEQLMAVVHLPKKTLNPNDLQSSVIELYRVRLDSIQEFSQNSCKFEFLDVIEKPDRFDAFVLGHDLRKNVLMKIGFFGRPHRVLVISYYDYSGKRNVDQFRERAKRVMDSVEVK